MLRIGDINLNNGYTPYISGQGVKTQSIISVWTAEKTSASSGVNSAEDADKSNREKSNKNTAQFDKVYDEYVKVVKDQDFSKNCRTLENSKIPMFSCLSDKFRTAKKSLTQEVEALIDKKFASGANADIDSMLSQLTQIIEQIKNIHSKATKSITIENKLNQFVANGGDLDRIDMNKLNEDILNSIENGGNSKDSKSTSESDDSEDKQIDEKMDEFIRLLESGTPEEIAQAEHDYIKQDKDMNKSDNNQTSQNMFNPFAKPKTKNPFSLD